jgi:hypothetical protein
MTWLDICWKGGGRGGFRAKHVRSLRISSLNLISFSFLDHFTFGKPHERIKVYKITQKASIRKEVSFSRFAKRNRVEIRFSDVPVPMYVHSTS